MSRSSDACSNQAQNAVDYSRASALQKLQNQRTQRMGQRNGALKRHAMCHSSSTEILHVGIGEQPVPDASPLSDQQSSSQLRTQRTIVSSQYGMPLMTTAVKGMHSRPPSRTNSNRCSCEQNQNQSQGRNQPLPDVQPRIQHTGETAGVQVCISASGSTTAYSNAALAIHGRPLLTGYTLSPIKGDAVARKAAVGICVNKLRTALAAPLTHTDAWAGGSRELGCGIPWHDLVLKSKAVRQRSLHHSRQQKEQQRMSLALVVITQWVWFMRHQQQQRLAGAQYHRHLLSAGWKGLLQEASRQQLLQCQASLHATKHAFMLLSRCFLAWQQLLVQQRRIHAAAAGQKAAKDKNLQQAAMQEWRQQTALLRRKRQKLLCAQAHRTFMSMLRCLQAWRTWCTEQQLKRLKHSRALQHWHRRVLQHLLLAWRNRVSESAVEWQQLATALCFHKCSLQRIALGSWQLAMQEQQERRTAAVQLLQQVQQQQLMQLVKQAVGCWQSVAQGLKQLQSTEAELVRRSRQQRKKQVLRQWSQLVQYHQQLDIAACRLSEVSAAWWCRHYLCRWQHLVEVMTGQRSAELRELVQTRACIGTWLKYTEQSRQQNANLSAATEALQRRRLRCLLAAWQRTAAVLQEKRRLQDLADHHHAGSQLRRLFLVWMQNAADQAAKRQQAAAADELHNGILLDHAWQAWHWYWWHNSMKRHVPIIFQDNLQRRMLAAWRQTTARKAHKMFQHRQAVRFDFLSKLRKVLQAWQQAIAETDHMQQLVGTSDQHYIGRLKAKAYQAWHGPFMQQRASKRNQLASAACFCEKQLMRYAIAAWRAGIKSQRAECMQKLAADQHCKRRLLQGGWQPFLLLHQQLQAERQLLAAAAEPALQALANLKQRQVLQAWSSVAAQEEQEKRKTVKAEQHHQQVLQHKCVKLWQQVQQRNSAKAEAYGQADEHRQAKLAANAVTALKRHVAAAVVKRQLLFKAAMHRRFLLLTKGWRAWRLTTAMCKLEVAGPPSQALQCLAILGSPATGSSSHPRPEPCLDAVAAAVVAASCSSYARWQHQIKQQWQQDAESKEGQQQLQRSSCNVMTVASEQGATSTLLCHMQTSYNMQQMQPQPHPQVASDAASAVVQLTVKRSAPRRQPRLPSFLRQDHEQQIQCQQSLLKCREGNTAHPQTPQPDAPTDLQESLQPHPTQQLGVASPAAEVGGQMVFTSCNPRQDTGLYPHAQQYPHQQPVPGCAQGAVAPASLVVAAAATTGIYTAPSVYKRSRPQPRPIRLTLTTAAATPAATVADTGAICAGQLPSSLFAVGRHPVPDVLVVDHAAALSCGAAPSATASWQQAHEQQQWQVLTELPADPQVQAAVQGEKPPYVEGQHHGIWTASAEVMHVHSTQDAWHNLVTDIDMARSFEGPNLCSRAAILTASTSSLTALHHQHSGQQQQVSNSGLLPLVVGSSDCDDVANERHYQQDQQLDLVASAEAVPGSADLEQQLPFTPMTRQMLQQEVAALEHTLQHCHMLRAAVQGRQQQANSLQQHIDAITQLLQSADTQSAQHIQQDQEPQYLELQEAEQQLSYVQLELNELLAEQDRQQPRLAAIAQRIQQLKEAASRQRLPGQCTVAQLAYC